MDWWSDVLPEELRKMMDGIELAIVHDGEPCTRMTDENWDVRMVEHPAHDGRQIWNAMCTSDAGSIRLEYRCSENGQYWS